MTTIMNIYQDIFKTLTLPCLVLEPIEGQFLIRESNREYFNGLAKGSEKLIGASIHDVFPENPDHLGTSWEKYTNRLRKLLFLLNYETHEFKVAYRRREYFPVKVETSRRVNSYFL